MPQILILHSSTFSSGYGLVSSYSHPCKPFCLLLLCFLTWLCPHLKCSLPPPRPTFFFSVAGSSPAFRPVWSLPWPPSQLFHCPLCCHKPYSSLNYRLDIEVLAYGIMHSFCWKNSRIQKVLCSVKRGVKDSKLIISSIGLINVVAQHYVEQLLQPTWIRVYLFTVWKLPGRKQVIKIYYLTADSISSEI